MKLGTTDISKIMVGSTEVTSGYLGTVSIFSSGPQPLDPTEPFYFYNNSNTNGNIGFNSSTTAPSAKTVYYSTDKTNWSTATTAKTVLIPIAAKTKVYFKISGGLAQNTNVYWQFRTTVLTDCSVGGNIMSLFYGTNFTGSETTIPNNSNGGYLQHLFNGVSTITDASKLLLPATTLRNNCYNSLFRGCTSLATAPELPATTLTQGCYSMMFYGCSNLNYVKCLATDISAIDCTASWVNGVSATGTFVKDVNMSSWTTGNNGIPTNWTVQSYPEPQPSPVPQPTNGYFYFDNVGSSPVTVTLGGWGNPNETPPKKFDLEYSTTGSSGWTNGFVGSYDEGEEFYTHFQFTVPANSKIYVRSNGYFYDENETGEYFDERFFIDGEVNIGGNPLSLIFGQSYRNNQSNMPNFAFSNVFAETPIVDASELYLPDYTTHSCYQYMFDYCKSLVTAPLLPATFIEENCYGGMFEGCTALENVYCLAETNDGTSTGSWLYEASATGTIVVSSNSCLALDTVDGIPTGWTIVIA